MPRQALILAWAIYRAHTDGPVNRPSFACALRRAWSLTLAPRRTVAPCTGSVAPRFRKPPRPSYAAPFGPVSIGGR